MCSLAIDCVNCNRIKLYCELSYAIRAGIQWHTIQYYRTCNTNCLHRIIVGCSFCYYCRGDVDSIQQGNPLYEEREIRMDMFELSDDETDG